MQAGAIISKVKQGSIAEEMELEQGDLLVSINGQPVKDLIDYRYLAADEFLEIRIKKKNGEEWILEVEKDFDEELGLDFDRAIFDSMQTCQNRCLFCFVDQMPPGVRKTLYVKDDDYRLSFLQGNFVTLTNLSDDALKRIAEMRLSPLFVSVHTTNPDLRVKMLNNKKAANILDQLRFLKESGIIVHTQIVLCPGINDDEELERTIGDLIELWPAVRSIAVVPVGLTKYRDGLSLLRQITAEEAGRLIDRMKPLQEKLRDKYGVTLVYLSDEFYLIAGRPIPPVEYYDEFEQLENGIGLVRLLYENFKEIEKEIPKEVLPPQRVTLITGYLGEKALQPLVKKFGKVKGLSLTVKMVENKFFGKDVTVTGLLTGSDILASYKDETVNSDLLILPAVMCRKGEKLFLDGLTPAEIEKELGVPVKVIDITEGLRELFNLLFRREGNG